MRAAQKWLRRTKDDVASTHVVGKIAITTANKRKPVEKTRTGSERERERDRGVL